MLSRMTAAIGVMVDTWRISWRSSLSHIGLFVRGIIPDWFPFEDKLFDFFHWLDDLRFPVEDIRARRADRLLILTRRFFTPPIDRIDQFLIYGTVKPPLTRQETVSALCAVRSEKRFNEILNVLEPLDWEEACRAMVASVLPTSVKCLQASGVDLNLRTSWGETPMHIAVHQFSPRSMFPSIPSLFIQLVNAGVKPQKDGEGHDPLYTHFTGKQLLDEETVEALLGLGCDPNAKIPASPWVAGWYRGDCLGQNAWTTMLHEAAAKSNVAAFASLLKFGAKADAVDCKGSSVSDLIQYRISTSNGAVQEQFLHMQKNLKDA